MSSANVKAIEALEAMRSALLKFKSDAAGSLYAMQAESRRAIEWLEERQRHWQKALQRRIEILQQARADLADCQSDGGNCSRETAMVQRARRDVDEAEQQLRNVQLHLKRVCYAHEEFEREARHLTTMLGHELLQGTALLTRSFEILSTYASGGGSEIPAVPAVGMSETLVQENATVNATSESAYKGPETDPELKPLTSRLRGIEGLTPGRWNQTSMEERMEVLQDAHNQIALEYGFQPRQIQLLPSSSKPGLNGYCTPVREIRISSTLVVDNDPQKALKTLAHESRHAYQYHAAKQPPDSLPKERREVARLWGWNLDPVNYKRADRQGFQAYYYQPVEVDARKLANEVICCTFGGA
jgi:hypothetical protein